MPSSPVMKSQSAQACPDIELKNPAKVPCAPARKPVVGLPPSTQARSAGVAKPETEQLVQEGPEEDPAEGEPEQTCGDGHADRVAAGLGFLGALVPDHVGDDLAESVVDVGLSGDVAGAHDVPPDEVRPACRRTLCPPPEHFLAGPTLLLPAPRVSRSRVVSAVCCLTQDRLPWHGSQVLGYGTGAPGSGPGRSTSPRKGTLVSELLDEHGKNTKRVAFLTATEGHRAGRAGRPLGRGAGRRSHRPC